MKRNEFLKSLIGLSATTSLTSFKHLTETLTQDDLTLPVLFVGHGSPMNAIEDNEFSRTWQALGKDIPTPNAILCISAHWETKGTFVTHLNPPPTIHDFGGFPKALFDVQYPALGSTWLCEEAQTAIQSTPVGLDTSWGLDHGAWSVLKHLYPLANIPVVQLSLDYTKDANYHYQLAKELASLRKKGVLIVGSGNMVHNFSYAQFDKDFNKHFGHDWALEANDSFKTLIQDQNHQALIQYKTYSKALALSAPTPDHYLPLLYTLALQDKNEALSFFNDAVVGGSFSMTGVKIG